MKLILMRDKVSATIPHLTDKVFIFYLKARKKKSLGEKNRAFLNRTLERTPSPEQGASNRTLSASVVFLSYKEKFRSNTSKERIRMQMVFHHMR